MSQEKFTVMIAGIVPPDMTDYAKRYLTGMMLYSRQDPGCHIYNIHQSVDQPNEFMMYSVWDNQQAFEAHNQRSEMQEFKKQLAKAMFQEQSPKTYWQLLEGHSQ
ncbi:MAG: putative quinol monooxygenase [Pseudomonadota bacterium]